MRILLSMLPEQKNGLLWLKSIRVLNLRVILSDHLPKPFSKKFIWVCLCGRCRSHRTQRSLKDTKQTNKNYTLALGRSSSLHNLNVSPLKNAFHVHFPKQLVDKLAFSGDSRAFFEEAGDGRACQKGCPYPNQDLLK